MAIAWSTYFAKQKDSNGGKIVMGPGGITPALGNVDYCEGANTEGFEVDVVAATKIRFGGSACWKTRPTAI